MYALWGKSLGNPRFFIIFVHSNHTKDDMKGKHCIFLLLILVALMACNDPKPVTETLHNAEALMNEYPDSAWTLLNTISPDKMKQQGNRALYALLYTQAQDKTYRDETNDSLISVAVDYYRDTDDVRRKFLSYYYKGRVRFKAKEYLGAVSCYMESEQLAKEVEDDYLVGLLYVELGNIYYGYYDYQKSLEAYHKATECFEKVGKIDLYNLNRLNQSEIYLRLQQYDMCEELLLRVLEEGKKENDRVLICQSIARLVMSNIEQCRMKEASKWFEELNVLGEDRGLSAFFLGKLSEMYALEAMFGEADTYMNEGWKYAVNEADSVRLYVSSAKNYEKQGKHEKAFEELLKAVVLKDKEVYQAFQQYVLPAQHDYLSEQLAFEAYRIRTEKRLNMFYILTPLLVLAVISYVFFQALKKIRKKSKQIICGLKREKKQMEEEKGKITSSFQLLDKEKKDADHAIQTLGYIIAQKEKSWREMEEKARKQEADDRAYEEVIISLSADLDNMQVENRKMLFQKIELLKNDLEHIVELVVLHGEKWHKEELTEKRVNEKIGLLRQDYFSGDSEYKKVEEMVNLYLDNVMLYFREEVSLSSEVDYRRVCYMFSGMSGPFIGWVMDESKDVVYQRKKRLLKKLDSLSCPHKEMFLLLLDKS